METEYLTLAVRWSKPPLAHINLPTNGAQRWYLNRWTFESIKEIEHLTIICIEVESNRFADYETTITQVMRNMWADHKPDRINDFEMLPILELCQVPFLANQYSITRTSINIGRGFYDHVIDTEKTVSKYGWKMLDENGVRADNMTTFQLHCKHEPHIVMVLQGEEKCPYRKMTTMRCNEPQTIYDLMKMNGVTCSIVWNCDIALSAKAPCTALCDHNMNAVYANRISEYDHFGCDFSKGSVFYHNMKYVHIGVTSHTLRHKPYKSPLWTSTQEIKRFAMYYHDDQSTLKELIEKENLFIPGVECTHPDDIYVRAGNVKDSYPTLKAINTKAADDSDDDDGDGEPIDLLCATNYDTDYNTD